MSQQSSALSQADYEAAYQGGPMLPGTDVRFDRPPWDIQEPQPVLVDLEASGAFTGRILDIGCGAGENALYLAQRGHGVTGVDGAAAAIAQARERAGARGVDVEFLQDDATELGKLDQRFDTVLDSALYHCLPEEKRRAYAAALHRVTNPGAGLHVFCGANDGVGLLAVSKDDLRANLGEHWDITAIDRVAYSTCFTRAQFEALASDETFAQTGMDLDPSNLSEDSEGRITMPVWHLQAKRRG